MGNKLSISSTSSRSSSSSTRSRATGERHRDRSLSVAHIPKHLKPAKPLTKQQREKLEKQQLQSNGSKHSIGVAVPYRPDNNQQLDLKQHNHQQPPFAFIPKEAPITMEQQQQVQTQTHINTVIDNGCPKSAFQWFEGRRYQNEDGAIILPNDQSELDRLRVLNYILRWAFEGDVVAPVKTKLLDGAHVLNVGCGPGIWLGHPIIDFALDYSNSHFTAVDVLDLLPNQEIYPNNNSSNATTLRPGQQGNQSSYFDFSPLHPMLPTTMSCSTWHQQNQKKEQHSPLNDTIPTNSPVSDISTISLNEPTTSSSSFSGIGSSSTHSSLSKTIPARSVFNNLDIYAVDIREHGLPFADNSFEFVMQRLSTPAFSSDQWKYVVGELIRVTQPGGYLQFIEIDYNTQGLGPAGQAWQDKCCEVMAKTRKLDPFMASHIDTVLIEHGLVNVERKKISMPLGAWGLDIGVLWQQNLEAFIEASAPALGLAMGISAAECKILWKGYKDELDHVKAFTNVHAVWGQKMPQS